MFSLRRLGRESRIGAGMGKTRVRYVRYGHDSGKNPPALNRGIWSTDPSHDPGASVAGLDVAESVGLERTHETGMVVIHRPIFDAYLPDQTVGLMIDYRIGAENHEVPEDSHPCVYRACEIGCALAVCPDDSRVGRGKINAGPGGVGGCEIPHTTESAGM